MQCACNAGCCMSRTSLQFGNQNTGQFRRLRPRRFLNLTAAFLVLALVGLFVGAGLLAHQVQAARDSMQLRREVAVRSRQLQTMLNLMQDAETGQRGLLLTGRASYLTPYDDATRELTSILQRVIAANSRDPQVAAHTNEIRRLADLKLAELAETIRLFRTGHVDQALEIVRNDSGQKYMQDLRAQTELAMQSLAEQGAAADTKGFAQMVAVKRLAWLTAVALTSVLVLAGLQLWSHVRLRAVFEKELAAQA